MTFEDLSSSNVMYLIDEWVHNERNRQILKRRWLDGVTYEKLAEEFDLSVRQIKNIIYRAERQLLKHV